MSFGKECRLCEKFEHCSDERKFLNTNNFTIQSTISFQVMGLFELYDKKLVSKAVGLLDRFRRFKGFRYIFISNATSIYLEKKDIPVEKLGEFVLNSDTLFYEFQ